MICNAAAPSKLCLSQMWRFFSQYAIMTEKFHPGGIYMKTGLVIEGGGVRGIYAAGVLDQLMEMGLHFDGVIGVSAGAIHGCSFLSVLSDCKCNIQLTKKTIDRT